MPRVRKKKTLAQKVEDRFIDMSWPKRILTISTLVTAALVIGGAFGKVSSEIDKHRPWADRTTELVVAQMQYDSWWTAMRDIDAKIVRLEAKRQSRRGWTQEDENELRYWQAQKRMLQQRMQENQRNNRPMYVR